MAFYVKKGVIHAHSPGGVRVPLNAYLIGDVRGDVSSAYRLSLFDTENDMQEQDRAPLELSEVVEFDLAELREFIGA